MNLNNVHALPVMGKRHSREPIIGVSALAGLPVADLVTIWDALDHAARGFASIANEPRAEHLQDVLDVALTGLATQLDLVEQEIIRRAPADRFDREAQVRFVTARHLERDEWSEACSLLLTTVGRS